MSRAKPCSFQPFSGASAGWDRPPGPPSRARAAAAGRMDVIPPLLLGGLIALLAGCGESSQAAGGAGPNDASVDAGPAPGDAGPTPPRTVEVRATAEGWQLLRNGEPYVVRGAGFRGGATEMDRLRAAGANTLRTWGAGDDARALLDLAHERGMTVLLGIWLEQVQQGFDYGNRSAVAAQLANARAQVERYKDHPALLAWGVGNEVELGGADGANMWAAIEGVAAMIKEVDPEHPTVVVTADIGTNIDRRLKNQVPSADIWGINAYGGAVNLADRLTERGWEGPYLLTEYGPNDNFEVPTTSWGAPVEPLPVDKAAGYAVAHDRVLNQDPRCLGGYAFFWGPPDFLDTWYTLVTPMGGLVESSLVLRDYWGGAPVADPPPELQAFTFAAEGTRVSPGAPLVATLTATDGDNLSYTWAVHLRDPEALNSIGALHSCVSGVESSFTFEAPSKPGDYRVLGVAVDESGGATMATGRFLVEGPATEDVDFPMRVNGLFTPTGWMGDSAEGGTTLRNCERPVDYCSQTCLTWTLERRGQGWGGAVWHTPVDNWEATEPGVPLASAPTAVTFTAWGEAGGEVITFFAGNQTAGEPYAELEQSLTTTPERYRMALTPGTKADITAGFGWSAASPEAPGLTFHVADIQWVAD